MWKEIPGFEKYEASTAGDIRSKARGLLSPYKNNKGYARIHLWDSDGNKHRMLVHRLVLLTFKGRPPASRPLALHGPRGKDDNSIGNLYWGDFRQNAADMKRDGTVYYAYGELSGTARLKWKQVSTIRKMYEKGSWSQSQLGELFGVCRSTISSIVRNETWNDRNRPRRDFSYRKFLHPVEA